MGRKVELVFDPFDLTRIEVRYQHRPFGTAVPLVIGRHTHPQAQRELPPPPAPTGIDYLKLLAEQRDAELGGHRIDYASLTDSTATATATVTATATATATATDRDIDQQEEDGQMSIDQVAGALRVLADAVREGSGAGDAARARRARTGGRPDLSGASAEQAIGVISGECGAGQDGRRPRRGRGPGRLAGTRSSTSARPGWGCAGSTG